VQHPATRGGDLRRGRHRPRADGRRSRREPEGPCQTAPSKRSPTEAGSVHCRAPSRRDGKPSPTWPHPTKAGPEGPPARGETHERARGVELVTDNTQAHDTLSLSPSASLRPGSPEKASRRIATSPSDVTPSWGSAIRNRRAQPPPFDRHRSRTRGKPRGPSVAARGIASDPAPMKPLRYREPPHRTQPGLRHARRRRRRTECTNEPVVTTSCGQRDKPTHRGATTGFARRRVSGVSQQESKTPSRGSMPFGGIRCADRCTRWLTTPAPSALRVSHPLSGLIPAHPRGCISSHIHP
jgi:hypothetical protein